jgi:hypothetical protein
MNESNPGIDSHNDSSQSTSMKPANPDSFSSHSVNNLSDINPVPVYQQGILVCLFLFISSDLIFAVPHSTSAGDHNQTLSFSQGLPLYSSQIQTYPPSEYNQNAVRLENSGQQVIDHDPTLIRNSIGPPNSNISSFQLPFSQGLENLLSSYSL